MLLVWTKPHYLTVLPEGSVLTAAMSAPLLYHSIRAIVRPLTLEVAGTRVRS